MAETSEKHENVTRVNWSEPWLTNSCVHLTKFCCRQGESVMTHNSQDTAKPEKKEPGWATRQGRSWKVSLNYLSDKFNISALLVLRLINLMKNSEHSSSHIRGFLKLNCFLAMRYLIAGFNVSTTENVKWLGFFLPHWIYCPVIRQDYVCILIAFIFGCAIQSCKIDSNRSKFSWSQTKPSEEYSTVKCAVIGKSHRQGDVMWPEVKLSYCYQPNYFLRIVPVAVMPACYSTYLVVFVGVTQQVAQEIKSWALAHQDEVSCAISQVCRGRQAFGAARTSTAHTRSIDGQKLSPDYLPYSFGLCNAKHTATVTQPCSSVIQISIENTLSVGRIRVLVPLEDHKSFRDREYTRFFSPILRMGKHMELRLGWCRRPKYLWNGSNQLCLFYLTMQEMSWKWILFKHFYVICTQKSYNVDLKY